MVALLDTLIDKVDNFERVTQAVGSVLVLESENQQALAQTAGKNPDDWKIRVYTERTNAFEEFLTKDDGDGEKDTSPIVNVFFDSDATDLAASDLVEVQKSTGIFYIDCYGYGVTRESAEGQVTGDVVAAESAKRAARLVRNILMSAHYYDLGMTGVVARRWVQSRKSLQPQMDQNAVQHVIALRLALHVDFIEQSPQVTGPLLEEVSVGVYRRSDGLLYATATFKPTE